jgi:hypothetical protein
MSKPQVRPQPIESPRLMVSTVYVEPVQVWFPCPACGQALEGYLGDPRGVHDIDCENCGATFDIPARAALVIT